MYVIQPRKVVTIVRAVGYFATTKPTADEIMVLELCSSDANKPLLLASPDFIPNLVDALMSEAVEGAEVMLYG